MIMRSLMVPPRVIKNRISVSRIFTEIKVRVTKQDRKGV